MAAPSILREGALGPTASAAATLRSWVASVTGVAVSVGPPPPARPDPADRSAVAVGVTLVGLAGDVQMPAERRRSALRLRARFLVWVDGDEAAALEALDAVLVGADQRVDVLLDLHGIEPATWTALGC